jgi:hypothetical protein
MIHVNGGLPLRLARYQCRGNPLREHARPSATLGRKSNCVSRRDATQAQTRQAVQSDLDVPHLIGGPICLSPGSRYNTL